MENNKLPYDKHEIIVLKSNGEFIPFETVELIPDCSIEITELVWWDKTKKWKVAGAYEVLINKNKISITDENDIIVESFDEYIQAIHGLKIGELSYNDGAFYLFRGMASKSFELVGRIQYDRNILRKSIEKMPNFDFVEFVEKPLFSSFKGRGRPLTRIEPKNDWEWMALSRHHGLPNRILDWSRDPTIALWFAVQDDPSFRNNDSVINIFCPQNQFKIIDIEKYYLNVEKQNYFVFEDEEYSRHDGNKRDKSDKTKFNIFEKVENIDLKFYKNEINNPSKHIKLFRPPSINRRIDFQSSWFSFHPYDINNNRYIGFDPDGRDKKYFKRIFIKAHRKYEIRRYLKQIGINELAIFQDLDNLGIYLKNKYFTMGDEFFSDQSLKKAEIVKTFRKLESITSLRNSFEIKDIKFYNTKGIYNRLINIFTTQEVKKLWTYNNIKRDFFSYRNQRLRFLKEVEKRVSENKIDYKRIQFLLHDSSPNDSNATQSLKLKKMIFDYFVAYADHISREHINKCWDNTLFMLLSQTKKEPSDECSFALVELGNGTKHLIVELNDDNIGNIAERQTMSYWFEIKEESEEDHYSKSDFLDNYVEVYKTFNEYFDTIFQEYSQPTKNKINLMQDSFEGVFESNKIYFIDKQSSRNNCTFMKFVHEYKINPDSNSYLIINYSSKSENEKEFIERKLLIPKNNPPNFFNYVHDILEYIHSALGAKLQLRRYCYLIEGDESYITAWALFKEKSDPTSLIKIDRSERNTKNQGNNNQYGVGYFDSRLLGSDEDPFLGCTELWLQTFYALRNN